MIWILHGVTRRDALRAGLVAGASALGLGVSGCAGGVGGRLRVSAFAADVTVPVGHGMMGGAWLSRRVVDPLEAHGVVIQGAGDPVVFVSVDWCEIRNDAYLRWQEAMAEAAGTRPERVMISTIHQHDAPVADLGAEARLRAKGLEGTVCDPAFHEEAVRRVARAARESMRFAAPVTHLGTGRADVREVASNRRYGMPDGSVRWDRTSATRNAFAKEAEAGVIDPWLRTLSFWNGRVPLACLHFFAVHPMSHYGQGDVSWDFPGMARTRRRREMGGVPQVYVSGCSGNVTAGKYNDGSPGMRAVLAERLREAMARAWDATERRPVRGAEFRVARVQLEPRVTDGFDVATLESRLKPGVRPFDQCLAAMGLSWQARVAAGRPIEVPCLDFGGVCVVLLPGESYVEFQLHAQALRPADFVCVAGYGDGATGYVPTERHREERDANLGDWCWVAPGAESRLKAALAEVLR